MKSRLAIAALAATVAAFAAECVPQSGDEVIIGDMKYTVIASADWTDITNRIAKLETIASRRWTMQHSTDAGRRAWHGASVRTEVDVEAKQRTTVYADGYRHVEAMAVVRPSAPRRTATRASQASRPQNVPAGAWALRRLREERKTSTNEVGAVYGPGGRLEEVRK